MRPDGKRKQRKIPGSTRTDSAIAARPPRPPRCVAADGLADRELCCDGGRRAIPAEDIHYTFAQSLISWRAAGAT